MGSYLARIHGASGISMLQEGVVVVESEGIALGKISYDNSKRSASRVKVEITCVSNRLLLVSKYQ
jgi:hypothetical protein